MKEVFELLNNLREFSRIGSSIIRDALAFSEKEDVRVGYAIIERKCLQELKETLERVSSIEIIEKEEMKALINEQTIPQELAMTSFFWSSFQQLIYKLYNMDK